MTLPRVLLVEDDSSIARFVQMALDELPIELVTCSNVADALKALHHGSTQLVITDLMLPGESGMGLVQRLQGDPATGRTVPVAVFSAGLTPAVREQLQAMNVWRMLSKPTSVLDLEACVRDALGLRETPALTDPAAPPTPEQSAANAQAAASAAQAEAIATHFAGDAFLFKAYRASCVGQFPADVNQGDAACARRDWQALRRLAHSLATVLLTLGYTTESERARQIEDAAAQSATGQCVEQWLVLRAFLLQL